LRAAAAALAALIFLRYVAVATSQNWAVDAAAYLVLAIGSPFIFLLSRNNRIDGFIGDLSYPAYIVHGAIGAYLAPIVGLRGWKWLGAGILATMVASMVLHWLIAKPVDRLRTRFGARVKHGGSSRPVAEPEEWGAVNGDRPGRAAEALGVVRASGGRRSG